MFKFIIVKFLLILILLNPIFSFSEISTKEMILGVWYDKENNLAMYFKDDMNYEIRIIRKNQNAGTMVVAPLIMLGKYQIIARSMYIRVYNEELKKEIKTVYEIKKFDIKNVILIDRSTSKEYSLFRDLTQTSQPSLKIETKIKKYLIGKWQGKILNKKVQMFFSSDKIIIKTLYSEYGFDVTLKGGYLSYSNIIKIGGKDSDINGYYIVLAIEKNYFSFLDPNNDNIVFERMI